MHSLENVKTKKSRKIEVAQVSRCYEYYFNSTFRAFSSVVPRKVSPTSDVSIPSDVTLLQLPGCYASTAATKNALKQACVVKPNNQPKSHLQIAFHVKCVGTCPQGFILVSIPVKGAR